MFLINLQGRESIYEQIRSQISRFIDSGILKPGDRLPSVRNLAEDLGINPNTVMKAYQELEKNGYIYTLNKKGVFVAGDIDGQKDKREEIMFVIETLKNEGYDRQLILDVLNEVYDRKEDISC